MSEEPKFDLTCTDMTGCMIDVTPCTALTITCENGKSLTIDYSDGKMHVECDADMNEAATVFFNEILKGLVDNYIESKLFNSV